MKQLCCFKGLGQYAGQAWWPTLKYSDADSMMARLLFLTIKDDSKNFFNPQITNRGVKFTKKPTGKQPSCLRGVGLQRKNIRVKIAVIMKI